MSESRVGYFIRPPVKKSKFKQKLEMYGMETLKVNKLTGTNVLMNNHIPDWNNEIVAAKWEGVVIRRDEDLLGRISGYVGWYSAVRVG